MKSLTILVVPISAVGHVNACTGTTLPLLKRGNRVIFLIDQSFSGKLKPFGFEEHTFSIDSSLDELKPGEALAHGFLQNDVIGPGPVEEKLKKAIDFFMFSEGGIKTFIETNRAAKEAIHLYNPDLILVDGIYLVPAIFYSNKPWIKHISTTPLFYLDEPELPPGGSGNLNYVLTLIIVKFEGFPLNDSRHQWDSFNQIRKEFFYSKRFNDLLQKIGFDRYPEDVLMPQTQILTIYGYPEELNYPQIKQKPWFNLEVFNKNKAKQTVNLEDLVPRTFLADTLGGKYSGKLIYLSLGSMGSVDLTLMNRLVQVLSKTPHKYIVSKGPCHNEYQLAANMWGYRYLPQTEIIPLVDAVITHGGNNTVTETFVEGKPMVVMPMFADQFDNAQRLEETGLGARIDPYQFEASQLVDAVNKLLYDKELHQKLKHAATRIQTANLHEQLCDLIETVLSNVETN